MSTARAVRAVLALLLLALLPVHAAVAVEEKPRLVMIIEPAKDGVVVDATFVVPLKECKEGCFAKADVKLETMYVPEENLYNLRLRGTIEGKVKEPEKVQFDKLLIAYTGTKKGSRGKARITGLVSTVNGTLSFDVSADTLLKDNTSETKLKGWVILPRKMVNEQVLSVLLMLEAGITPQMVNMWLAKSNITWVRVTELTVSHTATSAGDLNITFTLGLESNATAYREKLVEQLGGGWEIVSRLFGVSREIDYDMVAKLEVTVYREKGYAVASFSLDSTVTGNVEEYMRLVQELFMLALASGFKPTIKPSLSIPSSQVEVKLKPWTRLVVLPSTMTLSLRADTSTGLLTIDCKGLRLGYQGLKGEEATKKAATALVSLAEALKRCGIDVTVHCTIPGVKPEEPLVSEAGEVVEQITRILRLRLPSATVTTPITTMTVMSPTATPTTTTQTPSVTVKTVTTTTSVTVTVTVKSVITSPKTVTIVVTKPVTKTVATVKTIEKTQTKTITSTKTVTTTLKKTVTTTVVEQPSPTSPLLLGVALVALVLGIVVGRITARRQ